MNADTIGVTNASRDSFVLLVVPPQATPAAAATAMAMAADATNSGRPADLLAASRPPRGQPDWRPGHHRRVA